MGLPTDGASIRTRATSALFLAGALALAACGDDAPEPDPETPIEDPVDLDDGLDDEVTDPGPADDPDGSEPDGDEPSTTPEEEAGAPPLGDQATTEDREQDNAGFDLTVTDVRVGTHDGFDRVTVELDGDAQVGWFTRWDDEAILSGSGQSAEVDGEMFLTVAVRGVLLPPDRPDDVEPWDGETVAAAAGSEVLVEVVEGVLFEGQQQIFLGADRDVPYRIERFEDPQRIVIDLVHD